jgi:hypothetical protein
MRQQNFMLSEGETDDKSQIELTTVDMKAGCATIKNHGIVQIILLNKPFSLATTGEYANENAMAIKVRRAGTGIGNSGKTTAPENERAFSNGETGSTAFRGAAANNSQGGDSQNNSSGNNSTDNSTVAGNSSFDGSSGGNSTQVYQYWVKGAEEIEKARLSTAQQVRNGTWQPYPLTPLTPANTPPELIGQDSVFMEHGPGVIISSE